METHAHAHVACGTCTCMPGTGHMRMHRRGRAHLLSEQCAQHMHVHMHMHMHCTSFPSSVRDIFASRSLRAQRKEKGLMTRRMQKLPHSDGRSHGSTMSPVPSSENQPSRQTRRETSDGTVAMAVRSARSYWIASLARNWSLRSASPDEESTAFGKSL